MDFNIAKFSFPVSIRKAFDKGEIDKVYRRMYKLADELAANDARMYMLKKSAGASERHFTRDDERDGQSILSIPRQTAEYRERRLKYHMDNMIHLLKLYVQSKYEGHTQESN